MTTLLDPGRLKLPLKLTKNSIKPKVYYIRRLSLLFTSGGAKRGAGMTIIIDDIGFSCGLFL